LLGTSAARFHDVNAALDTGRSMFQYLFVALSGSCLFFIPLYAGIRLGMERWDNNLDLLFITTIRPAAIIRGKIVAAMVIAVLLFSAALPFMSFTYLLRGIDLPSVFVVLAMCFLLILVVVQGAVFLACLPASRVFKVILALGALGSMFGVFGAVNAAAFEMIRSGIGSQLRNRDFWEGTLVVLYCFAVLFGFLQIVSVALISPASANRALGIRLYVTGAWLLSGIIAAAAALFEGDDELMLAWIIPGFAGLSLAVPWAMSDSTDLSARVRRTIPRTPVMRRLAFLFYNGPAGGLAWACLLALLTYGLGWTAAFWIADGRPDDDISEAIQVMGTVFLYVVAYALAACLLWRLALRRRFRAGVVWVITMLLIAGGSLLPLIVGLLFGVATWRDPLAWKMGSLATVGSEAYRDAHTFFALGAAAILFLLNARWFWTQMRGFRRPPPPPPAGPPVPAAGEAS
jgi:hypothetical protein